jgi:hypothetical protein
MAQPPDQPKGTLSGLVGQLLAYVDKPWKAVAVAGLAVVGGLAWVAYEQRGELVEAWLTPDALTLNTDAVPAALDKLVEETGADLVQVWAVDLSANSQRFIAARRRDGERPVIPEPRRLPVIVRTGDLQVLVDVINGHPSCVDVTPAAPSPVAQRLAQRGMTRGCAIPIPPSPDAFVGVIYITWLKAPDLSAEEVAIGAARQIARTLVNR